MAGVTELMASTNTTYLSAVEAFLTSTTTTICLPPVLVAVVLLSICLLAAACLSCWQNSKVYVLDFSVFNPPKEWKFPRELIREVANLDGRILPEHVDFMMRLAERTGLGDETAVLPEVHKGDRSVIGIEQARSEFARTCLTTTQALFDKTGVKPSQINFVITNSSLFNPTPSLSATVMNHFRMGSRTRGYSLGGMGCSAGVIALDLAKELLELHPNSYAVVVSHENIINATYAGRNPSMLICNCLFRCNGSAVLVTNKKSDARRAKYVIRHIVRTNMAADDEAFNCVRQTEDDDKMVGIRLSKELVAVGERALRQNMMALGPLVLPLSEKLKFVASVALRRVGQRSKALAALLSAAWLERAYVPDFKRAFDHFCIHTGGRGIIDGLEKQMGLSRALVEPSRAVLYRFGNVSSTSVWYDLAYIEARQGVGKHQRVWQLAFGSGFKFNSAVLEANRDIDDAAGHPAWQDFDVAAMWVKLDELAAAAAAARAAKAARLAAEKQAADKAAATAVEARADTQLPRNATRDDADPAAAGDSAAGESGSATAVAAADKSSGSVKVYVQLKDSAFEKDQKH